MGSEQSGLSRSKSRDGGGNPSPLRQGSVSSEVEVPPPPSYVPYTVGRPIGSDSGASSSKKKGNSAFSSPRRKKKERSWVDSGTMITLNNNTGSREEEDSDNDDQEEIKNLETISSFLPIMRGSSRDPDILERLDVRGFNALVQRYSNHLRYTARVVRDAQVDINRSIKDTEALSTSVVEQMNKNAAYYAKYSDKLSKVTDMTRALNKCHVCLNDNIQKMEALNNMLPEKDRLEPFVWTTG